MRTPTLITLILSASMLTACASTTTSTDAKNARHDMAPISADSATLRVNGMSCPKCANNIERQLASLPGVETIEIDLGRGTVGVGFAPGVAHPSAAQLAGAIDNTGFTLVSIDTGADD